MAVFITGTDTNVGKTLVSSWLCLHTRFDYFKPIQTGSDESTDSDTVRALADCRIHSETYLYPDPVSPHLAATMVGETIDPTTITLPTSRVVVEGAGGVLVPINGDMLMVDLIKQLDLPTIVVARSSLGTINHTLLTLQALRAREIIVAGVIVSGAPNPQNCEAITYYGKTTILGQLPFLGHPTRETLAAIPLEDQLQEIFI